MDTIAPRDVVHRGVVLTAALLLDEALLGPRAARRRAILAWTPGATVHRMGHLLLIRLASPRWIACTGAPGLPLVQLGKGESAVLSAVPLTPKELEVLSPPPGAVIRMHAGALTVERPDDKDLEDPARYLDLSAVAAIATTSLGAPPPTPVVVVEAEKARKTRALFGVAPAPPELAPLLIALRAALNRNAGAGTEAGTGADAAPDAGEGAGTGPLSLLAALFASFVAIFARLFGRRGGAPSGQGAGPPPSGAYRSLATAPQEPTGPSLVDRLRSRLHGWLAEWLVRTRLARFLGRRQAEYIQRLMEMFEQGDLDAALRHAIPLGGEGGLPAPPLLGVPQPRADLRIALGGSIVTSSIGFGPTLFEELRRRYRAAFERLEREGRIDEAAFVLAELLQASEEAVAFLERHGRKLDAAKLAEARGLAPGLVVRQWFLAGDRARAVKIARKFGAFGDALVRLAGQPEAAALRILWAESLAAAGDFAAAVEVIWPLEPGRRLAAAWIDAAIALGGELAARMLVKKLTLLPASFPEVLPQALALLGDRAINSPAERRAFGEALAESPRTPASEALARAAARALVEDGARFGEPAIKALVTRLVAASGDDALRVDLPAWSPVARTPLHATLAPRDYAIAAADRGTTAVLDAAHLPTGQTVIALGEGGVRVESRREGGAFFHLDQPAERLVVSDRGDRALAIAPRGDTFRIARLDLAGRRTEVWCEAKLDAFAPDFDGSEWVVAVGPRLLSIDAAEQRFEALRAHQHGGRALRVARGGASCSAVVMEQAEGWDIGLCRLRFDLPAWTLRWRKPIERKPDGPVLERFAGASATSTAVLWRTLHLELSERSEPPGRGAPELVVAIEAGGERRASVGTEADEPIALDLRAGWVVVAVRNKAQVVVRLYDEAELAVRAMITLGGAQRACVRLGDGTLTVGDDRGRVLVVELQYGSLTRSLRI